MRFMNKKALELAINTIVILVLAILLLLFLVLFFTDAGKNFVAKIGIYSSYSNVDDVVSNCNIQADTNKEYSFCCEKKTVRYYENNEKVGNIKNIQSENKSITEATEGMELAISVSGVNFERRMKGVNFIYGDVSESQFKVFRKNKDLLSSKELHLLDELEKIEGSTILVIGKVLGSGYINKKIKISAMGFSNQAKKKLLKNNSDIQSIKMLLEKNSKLEGFKIIWKK